METIKMKKHFNSLAALVLLVFIGLTTLARDPGNGPFPLLIKDKIWKSADGQFELVFKQTKINSKQMDVFVTSACQTHYFGSSESVQRLDQDTYVVNIRDQKNHVWQLLFDLDGKRQSMHLILSDGVYNMDFNMSTEQGEPRQTCL